MRKIISFLSCMAILVVPLITLAAAQPKFDWFGGPNWFGGTNISHNMLEGKTLAEISARAAHQAALYGLPVEYKTEEGGMVLHAYPNSGKSGCFQVYERALAHEKLAMNVSKKYCDKNIHVGPYTETEVEPYAVAIPVPIK